MALPLLLGFGLPALAGSGMLGAGAAATFLGGLSAPTLAGIGAGLGSFLETGDVGKGIQTGLIAGLGGKAMGALTGGGNAALSGAIGGTEGAAQAAINASAVEGGKNAFLQGITNKSLQSGLAGAVLPGVGTAALVGSAMNPPTMKMPEKKTYDIPPPMPRIRSYQPKQNMDSTAEEEMITYYNPMQAGIMTNASTNYAKGGIVSEEMNEKELIEEAVAAIKGESDNPKEILGMFLLKFGEEQLRNLVESVQSGELDETRERFAGGDKGMVNGPGDGSGKDDMVPATMDGDQDVLLTAGEFVIKKDSTDAIEKAFGGGFLDEVNDAGKDAPKKLKEKVAVA